MVYQRERGENGTAHIQGYIRFKKQHRFKAVKEWMGEELHIEQAKGTEGENRAYCTKSETRIEGPWEIGEFKETKKGKRSDLEKIADMLNSNCSIKDVAMEIPGSFMRYHGGIVKYSELMTSDVEVRDIKCYVLWGTTGTGKTHRARTTYPLAYGVINSRDPWGAYNDQTEVLFDEFDWHDWNLVDMNRYCDKWSCRLDARYNNKIAKWNRVIICANTSPALWWPNAPIELRSAFFRRVIVFEIKNMDDEVKID